jgi:hypothetical protein
VHTLVLPNPLTRLSLVETKLFKIVNRIGIAVV